MEKKYFEGKLLSDVVKEDFEWNELIGEGAWSEIFCVVSKKTKKKYAIKIVHWDRIRKSKMETSLLIEEKSLLLCEGCDFIVDYFGCFVSKDKKTRYLIFEYCSGGSYFDVLKKKKKVSKEEIQLLAAELVLCLKFMKKKKIIHRDIKPENILFDDKNHIKLIDFGTAVIKGYYNNKEGLDDLKCRSFGKSTFGGFASTIFLCPEIIKDEKISYESDLWSLGCIIFQGLTGRYPFNSPSPYLLFKKISKREIDNLDQLDKVSKDLVDKLLQLKGKNRIGSGKFGFENLMAHEFFRGIDFKKMENLVDLPVCLFKTYKKRKFIDVEFSFGKGEVYKKFTKPLVPSMKLISMKDGIELILKDSRPKPNKKNCVMYYFYIMLLSKNQKVGTLTLSLGDDIEMNTYWGNVGYGVDKEFRGNRYAAKALKCLFPFIKQHEVYRFYACCDPSNIASRKTCERSGGKLLKILEVTKKVKELYEMGVRKACRYGFVLKKK